MLVTLLLTLWSLLVSAVLGLIQLFAGELDWAVEFIKACWDATRLMFPW
ncbi:MAG: hypothetical protein LBR73_04320 [Oscillospiraceae bacterium]|nr:hypothetical protein [Oscillospiraceae bacterium]